MGATAFEIPLSGLNSLMKQGLANYSKNCELFLQEKKTGLLVSATAGDITVRSHICKSGADGKQVDPNCKPVKPKRLTADKSSSSVIRLGAENTADILTTSTVGEHSWQKYVHSWKKYTTQAGSYFEGIPMMSVGEFKDNWPNADADAGLNWLLVSVFPAGTSVFVL